MSGAEIEQADVLVLGGGGILGEAWMTGVLAGLDEAEGFDALGCRCYVGTSAGSIVAAALVAGLSPLERLGVSAEAHAGAAGLTAAAAHPLAGSLATAADLGGAAVAPLVSFAFSSTAGGGALLRRTLLRAVRPGRRSLSQLGRMVEATGVSWDGRLRIAAVELETGRRVLFGDADAPRISVAAAVQASCAIPGVFAPVRAAGRTYVDGGAWSPTNMDAVKVSRGDRVLCLNPTGSLRPALGGIAGAIGPFSRGVSAGEALALRHRGASVRTITPDAATAALMGVNLMDPRPRAQVTRAALAQGRRLAAAERRRAA